MADLRIIADGALLIHKGIIEEAGPTRRIENLAAAKKAIVIDASGRIVMPAFVDPDCALVVPRPSSRSHSKYDPAADNGAAIRVMSRHTVEILAGELIAERVRYGCLTVGANTACATDLRSVIKILRVHRLLQVKPVRIRSLVSLGNLDVAELAAKWLPAISKRRFASILNLTVDPGFDENRLQSAAAATSDAGLAVVVSTSKPPDAGVLGFALDVGAMAVVAPLDGLTALADKLATLGCVRVVPAHTVFDRAEETRTLLRAQIDAGAAIAVSTGFRADGPASLNMQFQQFLWVQSGGLTAEEAIVASTYNAACSLRLSHVTGSLEPGKSADLLMIGVTDYRDLARRAGHLDLVMAMKAGKVVYRRSGTAGL